MSQTFRIGASRSSFASFHPLREWNLVRCHRFLRLFVCVVGTWRFISSMSTIVLMYHIRGASTVFCTFRFGGTCCIHHLTRNCHREEARSDMADAIGKPMGAMGRSVSCIFGQLLASAEIEEVRGLPCWALDLGSRG